MPTPYVDPYDDQQARQRAQQRQAATNRTTASQMAQQQAQPAGGNFQPELPESALTLGRMVQSGSRRPSPEPATTAPGYQFYYDRGMPPGATRQPGRGVTGTSEGPPQTNDPSKQYATQAMAGWDQIKWANQAHQTPKYQVGRILSNYAPTVEGLAQAIPAIQAAFPGATFDGKDKLTIPGVGTIDVLQGASQGGQAWQWLDLAAQGADQALPPVVPTAVGGGGGIGEVGTTTPMPPTYTPPGPQGPNPQGAWGEAYALLEQLLGRLDPNVDALKEGQKEVLLAAQEADRQRRLQAAAASGTSGSGQLSDPRLGEAFGANLTRAYRDIDEQARNEAIANRMQLSQAFQGLGQTMDASALNWRQLEQQASQHAAQMGFNYAQLNQQDKQFFQQLALQQAIAASNQNMAFWDMLFRNL